MVKRNKHKLLHTALIVIGIVLLIIVLWAIVVPHYTCKEGDCLWSFIGTNYSCDTCYKKNTQNSSPMVKSNNLNKKLDNEEKPKEIINTNEVFVQQKLNDNCNNCSPFYNNDYMYSNTIYNPYYIPQSRLFLPYYRHKVYPNYF